MLKSQSSQQSTNNILGINLDGQRLLLVYGSLTGSVFETISTTIANKENFPVILDQLSIEADKLLSLVQAQKLPLPDRVSLSITGDYDNETGILGSAEDFPEIKEVPVRSLLGLRFNLPVFGEQKANAGALAEYLFDKGKDVRNLVYVSHEPVLRLGILTDGNIYRNQGGTAGNIGTLLTGMRNPITQEPTTYNMVCNSQGMLRALIEKHPQHWEHDISLLQIIQDANNGDPYAIEGFLDLGRVIGQGLAAAALLLQPDMFVLGYPACLLGKTIEEAVASGIAERSGLAGSTIPKVQCSSLGVHLPALQALAPACAAYRKTDQ